MEIVWKNIELFTLCFARVSAFMFLMPVMGSRTIPAQARVGISALLSIFMLSIAVSGSAPVIYDFIHYFIAVIKEIAVGLTLGFTTKFLFVGIQIAGEIIGVQMGFGVAKVVDPAYQSQLSLIAEFQTMIAMLIYLSINGHYFLLRGLELSYSVVPINMAAYHSGIVGQITNMAAGIFVSAVKIGAPLISSLLLSNAALGILARTVPQMNIFIVGLPLKIGVGFLALLVTVTLFQHIFRNLWAGFQHNFVALAHLLF